MTSAVGQRVLKDKVALVTGAASGIGRSIAERFANEGARVLVCDMDETSGNEVAERIRSNGGDARFFLLDVVDPDQHERAMDEVRRTWGGLDIACNNAGITGPFLRTSELTPSQWDKVTNVNLSGVFYGMRCQLKEMENRGGGSIVNIASVLGLRGRKELSPYVASKHGVIGLSKNVALEYGAAGVRCNVIVPGYISTPLLMERSPEQAKTLREMHALERLGKAEEVANVALFLASSQASFVTGGVYAVDGGYLTH